MRDLEAEEFADIAYVRDRFMETARLFNFSIMEPSPLELQSTLEAKSGADISKEIYSFKDKGEREVALRFDLTIGLTRYVAQRRDLKMPVKIASFAGVWRYDEPQAGRYRYFHQWDIEIYGPFSTESDAEVIEFVSSFFNRLGLKVTIEISDRQLIEQYISERLGITDKEMVLELFRAVDKVPKKGAKAVLEEYRERFDSSKLKKLIDLSGVKGTLQEVSARADLADLEGWRKLSNLMDSLSSRKIATARINLGIVRGLDYYSGTVFEAFDESSGAGALVGGGRYDRLTDVFGRKEIGATGVAGGVERIILSLRRNGILGRKKEGPIYVAYTGPELRVRALEIATSLREAGFSTECDLIGRPLRKQLEDASAKNSVVAVIVAPEEIATNSVLVRILDSGKEERRSLDSLHQTLREIIKVGA